MKIVEQWIEEIKADQAKLRHWLERQYVGETLAAQRLQAFAETLLGFEKQCVQRIASDEVKHAHWVKQLLLNREMALPEVSMDGSRYWPPVLVEGLTNKQLFGAAALAEDMRLHRINALSNDQWFAADIRKCFQNILLDETFHAVAFAYLAGYDALAEAESRHNLGLEALGLEL